MPELEFMLERLVGAIILVMLVSLTLLATVSIAWMLAGDEHEHQAKPEDHLG